MNGADAAADQAPVTSATITATSRGRGPKTATLAYGLWGQNIGNAFFQLGGSALLRRALGDGNVSFLQDMPAYWTLNRKSRGNPEHWWNITSRTASDYVVFQGPSFDANCREALEVTLGELTRRGVEPVFLGVGMMHYTDEEVAIAKDLIDRHGIRTVVTRDHLTFAALDGRASYSGIDSAFFLPWAVPAPQLVTRPYVALNFERIVEPVDAIESIVTGGELAVSSAPPAVGAARRWADSAGRRSQAAAYAVHRLWPAQHRATYGPFEAVRLVHRTNPAHMAKIYRDVNVVASDEPYSYIATYAGAEVTFTDRVHACVATLAYGKPAMMWFSTPRNALLERVGIEFPMRRPVSIDGVMLEAERCNELEHLRNALA